MVERKKYKQVKQRLPVSQNLAKS